MGPWTRHHTRRLILLICAGSIGTFLFLHGKESVRELRTRLAMRELQRQCMLHSASPEQIVYDDDQATLRAVKESDPALGYFKTHNIPNARTHVGRAIKPLTELCNYDGGYPMPLFLHGRADSSGYQHLVYVHFSGRHEDVANPTLILTSVSQAPITPFGYPDLFVRDYRVVFPRQSNDTPVRFYAGQPNPVDPSRFVLNFEIQGQRGEIEGRLDDDRFVTLKLLSGPGELSLECQH